MSDITKASDNDIKKFLTGKLKETGLSLEDSVSQKLQDLNYVVQRNVPFYDMDEPKSRDIEIVAQLFFPDDKHFNKDVLRSIAQIALVIECKNIPGNIWVFSKENHPPGFSLPEYASMNYAQKDPALTVAPDEPIKNIPYASAYVEFIFDKGRTNGETNNLYSAIHTSTKATFYMKKAYNKLFKSLKNWRPKKQKYILHFTYFQSVIVFNGKIYLKSNKDGQQNLEEVQFVQMSKSYISKDEETPQGQIHIVNYDFIDEYLKLVEAHYRSKENLIIKSQKSLFQALEQ